MSWSISLSGPKHLVVAELRNAVIQLNQAHDTLAVTESSEVAFTAGGHGSINHAGGISVGSSHNITAIAPPRLAEVDMGKLTVMEVPVPDELPRYEPEPEPPAAS